MQHRAAGGAGMHGRQRRAQGAWRRGDLTWSAAVHAWHAGGRGKAEQGGGVFAEKKKGPRAGGTDFWAQRK